MQMHDLGNKPEQAVERAAYYPTETFGVDDVPSLKGKKLGEKVTLVIEGKITRVDQSEGNTRYSIEFRKCGVERQEKSGADNFVKFLSDTAEKAKKGEFAEDITRVPGQNSKAHEFNQQLNNG